ncbi:hypothetical protein WN943_027049 [Citrus x changshan-huyou]
MKPKRHLASSSKPAPSFDNMEDEKDIGVESNEARIQSIKDNPERIEVMTVQELRTILRGIGVPAKGSKRDPVSALKVYVEKKMEGWKFLRCASGSSHVEIEEKFLHSKKVREKLQNHQLAMKLVKLMLKPQSKLIRFQVVNLSSFGFIRSIDTCSLTVQSEPWTMLAHKKPQKGWIAYNPRTMRPPPLVEGTKSVKLLSWNVNGLRALLKLEGFSVWVQDANVISASRVVRSFVDESDKLPKGFRALGIMPNTWLPLTKEASKTNFDNHRLPPPYTKCNFLSAMLRPRSMTASTNSLCLP